MGTTRKFALGAPMGLPMPRSANSGEASADDRKSRDEINVDIF